MAEALGDKPILFLKNHGVIVTGRSVARGVRRALLSGEGVPAAGHGLLHGPAAAADLRQSRRRGRGRVGRSMTASPTRTSPSSRRCSTPRTPATPTEGRDHGERLLDRAGRYPRPRSLQSLCGRQWRGVPPVRRTVPGAGRGQRDASRAACAQRNVVLEFPSYADAVACYRSAEYQPVKAMRTSASQGGHRDHRGV